MAERAGDLVQVGDPVSVVCSDPARRAARLVTVITEHVDLPVWMLTAAAPVERNQSVRRFHQSVFIPARYTEQLTTFVTRQYRRSSLFLIAIRQGAPLARLPVRRSDAFRRLFQIGELPDTEVGLDFGAAALGDDEGLTTQGTGCGGSGLDGATVIGETVAAERVQTWQSLGICQSFTTDRALGQVT